MRHFPSPPVRYTSRGSRGEDPCDQAADGHARVAKLADAKDLKSFFPQGECGFNSRPGHQTPDNYIRDGFWAVLAALAASEPGCPPSAIGDSASAARPKRNPDR